MSNEGSTGHVDASSGSKPSVAQILGPTGEQTNTSKLSGSHLQGTKVLLTQKANNSSKSGSMASYSTYVQLGYVGYFCCDCGSQQIFRSGFVPSAIWSCTWTRVASCSLTAALIIAIAAEYLHIHEGQDVIKLTIQYLTDWIHLLGTFLIQRPVFAWVSFELKPINKKTRHH